VSKLVVALAKLAGAARWSTLELLRACEVHAPREGGAVGIGTSDAAREPPLGLCSADRSRSKPIDDDSQSVAAYIRAAAVAARASGPFSPVHAR